MVDFDAILRMDWVSPYYGIVNYHANTITVVMSTVLKLMCKGTKVPYPNRVISFFSK